jgi:SAM-dependent methyltransferase
MTCIRSTGMNQEDIEYFNRGSGENPNFWERFNEKPDFQGRTVLDIGCGHGSLCIDMALSGARKVVGLDINSRLIEFAKNNLRINYPQLLDRVRFECATLADYQGEAFDLIVSKDSFEHVIGLEGLLTDIKKRLKECGKLYAGFAPLYNAPFGDHKRTKAILPWGHVLIPESLLIKRLKKQNPEIHSIYDLGLNKLSLREYKKLFHGCGLAIIQFDTNRGTRLISKIITFAAKLLFLEEYFTHNIYIILEKRNPSRA